MCFLGVISQSHLRVTESAFLSSLCLTLSLCHLWVCAPYFSQSPSPSCRCLPCSSSLHLCMCVFFHVWCTCTSSSLHLCTCIFMSDVRAQPAAAPFWVHLFIKTCFPLHLSVWVRPSDHSALCFQLLHASTLACIMDLPVTSHKHPKGTTLTIPTVSFPQCRFIDTGLLISLSWSCCFFDFSVSDESHYGELFYVLFF